MSAVEYFKQNKGFDRLIADMAALYTRHGRVYGAVRLANPTAEEEKCLSEFFERDYFDQALIRISLGDFARQLKKKFDIKFEALLMQYPGKYSEVAPASRKDAFAEEITKTLLPKYEDTCAGPWLAELATYTRRTYKVWIQQYVNEPAKVLSLINKIAELLVNLPVNKGAKQLVPLTKFSAQFLGSPYELDIFDTDGEYNALFLRALAHHFSVALPCNIEDTIALYLKAGLLTGGILCHVAVQGVDNSDTAQIFTLDNIASKTIKSQAGKVFVIENPQVFASVAERLRGINCTIVSPMGSHSPAFLLLLEQLCKQGDTIYYAGNMDYKGLAQADKLFLKFGKQFVPWRYSKEDYELAISDGLLPDEKKNLSMHHDDLALVLSQMRKRGKAANAMPLVPLLVQDVIGLIRMRSCGEV